VAQISLWLDREEDMAGKKANPAPAVRKAGARTLVRRQVTVIAVGSADPRRLLREAAWSQMFGRVESKNPFTPPA
jgi:hypothetical protein